METKQTATSKTDKAIEGIITGVYIAVSLSLFIFTIYAAIQ